jgi:superfamily II DNA helicase RecQ
MEERSAAIQTRYRVVRYDVTPAVETISELQLPELANLVAAADHRLEEVGKPWRIKLWQAAVGAEILAGRDVVVKAQTGSGKSMCYLALAMLHPKDCIVVICPLLALMADQVRSAMGLGINAVQLTAATMRDDPGLLNKVRRGDYSMVFIAAEFTGSEA